MQEEELSEWDSSSWSWWDPLVFLPFTADGLSYSANHPRASLKVLVG